MFMIPLEEIDLEYKRVFLRVDFNVPIENKTVTNDFRIKQAAPTIKKILEKRGSVILVTHIGRPNEGKDDTNLSTALLIPSIEKILGIPVKFLKNWIEGLKINQGEVLLCENVRFLKGETSNDPRLAKKNESSMRPIYK